MRLGLEVFAGIALALAPFLVASVLWWSGVASVALFAVFVAVAATATNGVRVGVAFSLLFAVVGTAAVAVDSSPVLAALLVAASAGAIALCTLYGFSGPMLIVAMFVPYLIHEPPAPLANGQEGAEYYAAVAGALLAAGAWGCLLTWLLRRHKELPARPTPPAQREAVLAGAIVAMVTGLITYVAITHFNSTEWVWILLTIFVLTKPSPDLNWGQTKSRIFGTLIGVAVAASIGALGLPPAVVTAVGVLALTAALTLRLEGRAYWLYASYMTPAVILFDSATNNTTDIAIERLLFTVLGAIFAVGLAAAINTFVLRHDDLPQH